MSRARLLFQARPPAPAHVRYSTTRNPSFDRPTTPVSTCIRYKPAAAGWFQGGCPGAPSFAASPRGISALARATPPSCHPPRPPRRAACRSQTDTAKEHVRTRGVSARPRSPSVPRRANSACQCGRLPSRLPGEREARGLLLCRLITLSSSTFMRGTTPVKSKIAYQQRARLAQATHIRRRRDAIVPQL
ncbi:hypothetical protein PHLGIDRAFT_447098 [Phlebiopsis gigantea 11061_1 CR5-6]|uniref:Uncharacterized protein n=1 Tax=Phlebiopsis gigantea (strain 11061_1 CR5-6) TaxID=745531 RepID=A0A0C3PKD7_PHLG1|nr:hypothetical protein PHLGIDRAFT_447098 [Phlebiopsis gigantea 11061_1 CR5-6]